MCSSFNIATCSFALLFLLLTKPVNAEIDWSLDGFGTFGIGYLNDEDINLANGTRHNTFEEGSQTDVDSKIALQAAVDFNSEFAITAQAVARAADDYDPELEWGYASWKATEKLKLRVGRLRRSTFLISDTRQIGYTYPWIRPPVEVYSNDLGFFVKVDAINALYQWSEGARNYQLETYIGESSGDAEVLTGQEIRFSTKNDIGIILSMEQDWLSMRFGYHYLPDANIGNTELIEPLFDGLNASGFSHVADDLSTESIDIEFYDLALGIDYNDWLFNFEYIFVPIERSIATDEKSWFAMFGKRIGPVTLHYTFAVRNRENSHNFSGEIRDAADSNPFAEVLLTDLADNVDIAVNRAVTDLESHTFGLRYDLDSPVAIKGEYQRIVDKRNNIDSGLFSIAVDFLF